MSDLLEKAEKIVEELKKKYRVCQRPRLRSGYLLAIDNQKYIENVHHGLYEFEKFLSCLYPFLNLLEVFAIANGLQKRENDVIKKGYSEKHPNSIWYYCRELSKEYRERIMSMNFSDLLVYLERKGHKEFEDLETLAKFNPYSISFKKRIELFSEVFSEVDDSFRFDLELRMKMCEVPITWCFECQYEKIKRERGGDNYRLKVMEFMPVYPKNKDVHIKKYATEISKMMKDWPTFYIDEESIEKKPLQLKLFKP